jgi:hypothetical protein
MVQGKEAASAGAALTLVFWGFCHALAQLLLCYLGTDSLWRRVYVFDLSPLLPCISPVAIRSYLWLWHSDRVVADLVPVLC